MFLGGCVMCSRTSAVGFIALVCGQVLHGGRIWNSRIAARGHQGEFGTSEWVISISVLNHAVVYE